MLLREEVGIILDAAVEVHRILGHGLLEKPYENALARELQLREIPFQQQPRYPLHYKDTPVGEYIPDLVVFDSIIVDTKTIDKIGDIEVAQMMNYLRISNLRVGFIINFKHRRIETRRIVL